MNGRQALGCGISAQEMTNTTAKKAANSIVGKLTKAPRPLADASSDDPHDSQAGPLHNCLRRLGRSAPAAASAAKVTIGIGDQSAATFADGHFAALGLKRARS